ncbi:MAG: peptidyl-prolyl cis-trans isomerase [Candidatus Omnitrophota bacterium]|nr:peptidyl-prolyl cis-trans isomerase [Candidatus Omnitrophota bacterium]
MDYLYEKGRIVSTFFIFLIAIFLVGGCDQIPFLSKIFPQQAKQEQAASTIAQPEIKGTVLVKVDNWVLTLEEFNQKIETLRKLSPDFKVETFDEKKNLLEELIRQQLLVKEAQARGLDKKREIIDAVAEFERGLLVRALLVQLTEDIKVEPKEIEDYYNQYKEVLKEPAQWRIREIVVATPQQANDILIELLKGADFASMASQYSKADSAKKGGDLGFVSQAKFPQLQMAIVSLDAGSISNVIKGPDGFYIVKLEEKKGGKEKQLSEIWDDIKNGLTILKQNQKLQDYLAKLKQNTKEIVINDGLLR